MAREWRPCSSRVPAAFPLHIPLQSTPQSTRAIRSMALALIGANALGLATRMLTKAASRR